MHLDSEPKWPIQSFKTHAFSAGKAEKQPDRGSWGVKMGERNRLEAWYGGYFILVPGSLRSCGPRDMVGGGGQEAASGAAQHQAGRRNNRPWEGGPGRMPQTEPSCLTPAIRCFFFLTPGKPFSIPVPHKAWRGLHSP